MTNEINKSQMAAEVNGWLVSTSEDGQYLYVTLDGSPGQIHIKAEDEGFVVDIWADGDDGECIASTSASYPELEPE